MNTTLFPGLSRKYPKPRRSTRVAIRCIAEALERRVMLSLVIPVDREFRVNTYTTLAQVRPSAAMEDDGNFLVAWASSQQDGSNWGVYAQRYSIAGVAQGEEFRVNTYTTGRQEYPSIAIDPEGDFVVAWSGYGLLRVR